MSWLTKRLFPEIFEQMESIMATVNELIDAIATEKAQVQTKLDALAAEIQTLKDQIANGGTVTEAQLDVVLEDINNIFTPDQPE